MPRNVTYVVPVMLMQLLMTAAVSKVTDDIHRAEKDRRRAGRKRTRAEREPSAMALVLGVDPIGNKPMRLLKEVYEDPASSIFFLSG